MRGLNAMAIRQDGETITWAALEALAARSAEARGVANAQALRFGAAVARHFADRRPGEDVARAIQSPDIIASLSKLVEDVVEAASVSRVESRVIDAGSLPTPALAQSYFRALPCKVDLIEGSDAHQFAVGVRLDEPNGRPRPVAVIVPGDVLAALQAQPNGSDG